MLFTQVSFEELDSCALDVEDFNTFGDFNVLDYADTPQVSPSTIINEVDDVIELDEDEEETERKSPEDHGHRTCKTVPRYRRESHVRAEKKRRNKIQDQLRTLHDAIPTLRPLNHFQKLSEYETVDEAGKYLKELRLDRTDRQNQLDQLRKEREKLKQEFDQFQDRLPTRGIKKEERKITLADRYTGYRSEMVSKDWKYAIFDGLVGANLSKSYVQQTESENSPSGFINCLMEWTDTCLCLKSLRPVVISGLRDIATNTSFLQKPEILGQEITQNSLRHSTLTVTIPKTPCTITEPEQKHRSKSRPISATVTSASGSNLSSDEEIRIPILQIFKKTKSDLSEVSNVDRSKVSQIETIDLSEVEDIGMQNLQNRDITSVGTTIGNIIPILSTFDSVVFSDPDMEVNIRESLPGMIVSAAEDSCSIRNLESNFVSTPENLPANPEAVSGKTEESGNGKSTSD